MPTKSPVIEQVSARAYRIPTDGPEADGTLTWDHTTLVTAEVVAGGVRGFGYTYSSSAAAVLIREVLQTVLLDLDAIDIPFLWRRMVGAVRNVGRRGVCATAISALDAALWDLKAKLMGVPLVDLLGAERSAVPIYGSGGFTNYSIPQLTAQLRTWVERDGCRFVKMKVGSDPSQDEQRVQAAAEAIGSATLFVDANGVFHAKQALWFAERFAAQGVKWFEEPVSSDDLRGLAILRKRAPAGLDIAAGEYGYDQYEFRQMLAAGAVDVLQADASRCGGITGFMQAAALADAFMTPLSAHTAPSLHLPVCCAAPRLRHTEWFYDHVRIERMLFDGAPVPKDGLIQPDLSRPGLGVDFRQADAEQFAV